MKRIEIAAAVIGLGLGLGLVGGCGSQGMSGAQASMSVERREPNGEPVMGAGDDLGWSLYQKDRAIAQAKAEEAAERERALASHPE